jgi:molybdopterin-guanine dinucleotide biosynthesis protein A
VADRTGIAAAHITGVVLAGGRGTRMGGTDKGLQLFAGLPLVQHALRRLAPQVGATLVNANRNQDVYATFGARVCSDSSELGEYAGPLAGFVTALEQCGTPYLVTVPCDSPLFPPDLVERLAQACAAQGTDLAMACAPEQGGPVRAQPVFCLMHQRVLQSLRTFVLGGGRKIDTWTAQMQPALVAFDRTSDDTRAFFNANTLDELRFLESL